MTTLSPVLWRASYLFLIAFGLFCSPLAAQPSATLVPNVLFSDGAVLQRDQPLPVWGTAQPGAGVTVKFRQQSVSGQAGPDGNWKVELKPEPAGGPDQLSVETSGASLAVANVLVGEVWLAAGQSNMGFKTNRAPAGDQPTETNSACRFFSLTQQASDTPLATQRGRWVSLAPDVTPGLSAVAVFFGQALQAKLGVPVGIIVSAVGGTSASAWLSPAGFDTIPPVRDLFLGRWAELMKKYPEAKKAFDEAHGHSKETPNTDGVTKAPLGPDSPKRPIGLFNGMINPIIPYGLRGIVWYQGESDATADRAEYYPQLLRALLADWRSRWKQDKLPVLLVQLPAFGGSAEWASLQSAQQQIAREPGNSLAVTLDLGEEKNVHPLNKKPVGQRLANLALADVYGQSLPAHSPRAISAARHGSEVQIDFALDPGVALACRPVDALPGLEVAAKGGEFKPATARQQGNSILVSSPNITEPVAVRYGWAKWPAVTIFDANGLPSGPFSLTIP